MSFFWHVLTVASSVADESLYHARLHPEQYCNEFDDAQMKKLHESIRYVCQTAVDKLADSDEFPEHWLFNHRWGKGKKETSSTLPNGEKLAFLTVGGRTSCYAPGLQKKTGHVAPGIKEEPLIDSEDDADVKDAKKKGTKLKKTKAAEMDDDEEPPRKKSRAKKLAAKEVEPSTKQVKEEKSTDAASETGRRRSGRIKKAT